VRTAAPSDFITSVGRRGAYILPTRDLIASDIEVQVEGALLDGMLCLASCDKTTPGQLMAAGRLNIPTIVVVCGYQQSGEYRGQHVDIEEVFLKSGYVASGAITVGELADMADVAVRSPGVCAGMGTANSMHVVCEALGMAPPGSAPVAANSRKMMDHVRQAGARIVEMVWQDLTPRTIITPGAVRNAVLMVLALSGSINCVKHLQAIATEAELDVDVYQLFADYAEKIPLLAAIRPNGKGLIEELEAAGGARTVLKRLQRYVDGTALTVTGKTLGDELADVSVKDDRVIRTIDNPLSTRPSINIVRGNLLPGGGIVRLGGVGERTTKFTGRANVFHSRDEALAAIKQVGIYVRLKIAESPIFSAAVSARAPEKFPLITMLKQEPKPALIVFLTTITESGMLQIFTVFALAFSIQTLGIDRTILLNGIFLGNIAGIVMNPFFGWLSDYTGRRPLIAGSLVLAMLYVSFVFFPLLQTKDPTLVTLAIAIPPAFIQTMIFAVEGSWYAELFRDSRVRFSGVGFARQMGSLVGGFFPLIAFSLYASTGSVWGPAGYYLFTSVISLAAVFAGRETRLEKLQR
jgi:Dehydratase family